MDDEFALCWNNFQENIASGFQNLFDRGDLVDVTLACEGKLLQAHKIVLAICSPYFQEMFITNPCRHPIIVLKDVSYTVMTELLQFMYQGVVNVKHTELNSFMKIAQQLQIKGLATSSSNQQLHQSQAHHHLQKSPSSPAGSFGSKNENYPNTFHSSQLIGHKRTALDYSNLQNESGGSSSLKKHMKRSSESVDNDVSTESMENLSTSEDGFPIPQISMIETGRFDLSNVKRETGDSPGTARNLPAPFNFDYNRLANASAAGSSASTINANHMEIPTGGNVTMLSSTSLLHANCIFNRNNTVATQQGMKTYWLCKSYRITMCRARCITHQGRVLSATGVHNHQPHMKGSYPNSEFIQSGNTTTCTTSNGNSTSISMRLPSTIPTTTVTTQSHSSSSTSQSILAATTQHQDVSHAQQHLTHENRTQEPPNHTDTTNDHQSPSSNHQHHSHHNEHGTSSTHDNNNSTSLQHMMQNVLSQNNLVQLNPNMATILNPMHNHSHMGHLNSSHLSNELHVTPSQNHEHNENLHSPVSPRGSIHHAQLVRHQMTDDVNRMTQHHPHSTDTMHGQQQQHHHHHHHQSNETNSPVGLSPIETPPHRSQISSDSDSNVHHSLANEMNSSSSFKLEQI